MPNDGSPDRIETLRTLVDEGLLSIKDHQLTACGLSPKDRPGVRRHIQDIGRLAYERLDEAKLQFDVIASIPTGGDGYATEILRHLGLRDGRMVSRILLTPGVRLPRSTSRERVIVVDDAIFNGITAQAVTSRLEKKGYQVVAYLVVADLVPEVEDRQLKAPVISVFDTALIRTVYCP